MLKLAIAAGITLSALLCGMMTLGSKGFFQGNRNGNNKNLGLVNDIKEIFGLYPIGASNSQLSGKSPGESSSSFSFGGDGGYLPPKAVSENDSASQELELTTPVFRIFILPSSTTTDTPSSTTTTSSPTPSTTSSPTVPPSTVTSTSSVSTPTKETLAKEESLGESTTVASVASSPTPYPFVRDPSPAFKIDLIWSTLVPPSLSNVENEVSTNENTISANSNGNGGARPINNGLYLPPNKEYLPPNNKQ